MLISFITFATTLSTSNTQFKVPFLSEHSGLVRWCHPCVGTRTWADLIELKKMKKEECSWLDFCRSGGGGSNVLGGRWRIGWERLLTGRCVDDQDTSVDIVHQCWHYTPPKHIVICVCNTVAPRWKRSLEVNFFASPKTVFGKFMSQ